MALTVPFTIANLTVADGNEVQSNFDAIETWANGSALEKGGGTMTGALILSGAPVAANGAATKTYVDGKAAAATPADGSVTKAKMAAGLAVTNVVADPAARDALTGMQLGDRCFVSSQGLWYRYTGSAWKIDQPQTGSFTFNFASSTTSDTPSVNFPVAFAGTPQVVLTPFAFTGNTPVAADLVSVTPSGFSAIARNVAANASGTIPLNGSVSCHWMAFYP